MLDYNINIFLNNISNHFGITRLELEKFKDYKKENIECIKKITNLYIDRYNNNYILLEKQKDNTYYAIKLAL